MKLSDRKFRQIVSLIAAIAIFVSIFPIQNSAQAANPWDNYSQYLQQPSSTPDIRGMRATWLVTAYGSDWPSTKVTGPSDTAGIQAQKQELIAILDRAVELNLNAVMYQVRPASDAMYKSDLVPWSGYLSGGSCANAGVDPGYNPLEFAIEEAHKRGLELHAWCNPYRAATAISDTDVAKLTNVDKSIFNQHPEWVKKASDGVYVADPGNPGVQKWVKDCVMEIVKKYDVDGIHFDDYFYHETVKNDYDDSATFTTYGAGFNNKEDWRRNNVTSLIESLSQEIRSEKPWVKFGISPAGVWGNIRDGHADGSNTNAGGPNYDKAFADTRKWANDGVIDYICPQVYWSNGLEVASYGEIATWWAKNIINPNTQLYIGMALYKANANSDLYWMEGEGAPEIDKQLKLNANYPNIDGSFLYQSSNLSATTQASAVNSVRANWPNKAIVPAYTWKNSVPPAMPTTNEPTATSEGAIDLTWSDNDTNNATMYYCLYRFGKDENVNTDDATKLIATVGKSVTSYHETVSDPSQVKYVVTALDRLHNQSFPNAPVPVTGSAISIDVSTATTRKPILPPSVSVPMSDGSTANMMVKWNAVQDSSVTSNGSFQVNGQVLNSNLTVTANVTVKDKAVKYAYPVKTTTARGTKPTMPTQVNVVYTDDSVAVCSVTWNSIDSASYANVGVFSVNGTVDGSSLTVRADVIVIPDITSITEVSVSTMATVNPMLPGEVEVTYSDSKTAKLPVIWDNINTSSYASEGSFKVNGTVDGTTTKAVANVTVTKYVEAVSVDTTNITSGIAVVPTLPSTVNVNYNDGSTAQRPVVWNTIDATKLAFTNRFKVSGTVDGIKLSATAIVKVASKIVIDDYEDVGDGSSKVTWTGASITNPVPTPPTVSYNTVKDYIKSGERSLKVDYNFVASSGTASAYVTPVNEIKFTAAAQPKKIGMWVYGDGSNLYQLRISVNASSSTFAKVVNSGKLDYTGWKYLEFDMPTDLIGKDTYLTFAPGLISTSQRISSTIYVDDLVAIYGTDTIDYTEVNAAISAAQDIYDTATVGAAHGNYTANAKAALQKAVTSATSVKNNTAATLEEIYTATDFLNTTVEAFKNTQIVSQKEVVLDDFEKYKSSSSDNTEGKIDNKWYRDSVSTATATATIGIATDSTHVKSGSQSLMIQYSMGDGPTATSALKLRFNDNNGFIFDKGKCPDKIGFWFYGDSSGNRSRIQLNTVAGLSGGSLTNSTYNAYDDMSQFTPMSWSGWHYVELPVASLKPVFSDANNYVAVTIPYWIQYLSGGAKTGTLYIDDYKAIYNVTSQTPIDKTGLNAAILTAQAKTIGVTEGVAGGLYPVGSTLILKNAVSAAKLGLNSDVQADITQTQTTLETAIKAFVDGQIPLLDKVGLKSLIDSAQSKYAAAVEGSQPDQYVTGSKAVLLVEINAANDVYIKADATKLEIDTAKANITAAIEKFDLSVVPKLNVTALNQKISEAEALYDTAVEGNLAGQYKAGAKATLLAEINTAKGAITNVTATQASVDAAVTNLTAAIQAFDNNMIPLNVDKDLLRNTISATQSRVAETTAGTLGGQYPQTARTAISDAIQTALKISENIRASQDEVNAAIPVLNEALATYLNTRIAAPWDAYSEYIPNEVSAQKRELRAVWVSTVINIDWPSKTSLTITDTKKRVEQQKAELVRILDGIVGINGNAVMFQVRPTSDAFYKSDLAPWSYFMTGSLNGDPGFDPLAFAVEEAHKRNLELHTWFNPYRVSMPATFYGKANLDEVRQMLASEPKSIYSKHPEWAKVAQNRLVLDPGIPEARKYVEDCIMEVVNNYDVDGVHFDDYFYVGTTGGSDGITDTDTYQKYGSGFINIEDWRRNNTYLLIKELSEKIKISKPWVKFGISPAGVWANKKDGYPEGSATGAGIPNYSHAYADTKKWVLEEKIDYICPQIYWTFGNSAAGFGIIADWWADLLDANPNIHTQLYIGEGVYWLDPLEGASDKYWLNGEGANELERQFKYNITRPSIKGTVIFTYSTLKLPQAEAFVGKLKTSLWNTKALVPEMPYKGGVAPSTPSLQSAISGVNGAELKWTDNDNKTAYFAIYRFDKNEEVNINDAKHLVDTVRKTANGQQNYVDTANKTGSGKYVVTALNRLHDESLQSNKVDVSGLPVIDKAGLLSLINNAQAEYDAAVEGVKPGQYAVGSKADLLIVINSAKAVSVKVDVTKEEIDTAKLNLLAAMEKFNANAVKVPAINLTILNQNISAAQALLDAAEEGSSVGQYKVGAKAALLAGINRAKAVLSNTEATQVTIDAAVITLTADIQTFTSTKIISSGNSGSTQGSSGTAPSTNIKVNSDGTTTLKTETTRVDKTSVTAKISKEDITKAFEQAKVDKAGNKKIIVEATGNDNSLDQLGYQIPVEMLSKTDGKNIIELRLSNADISLPTNMLTDINTGNGGYAEIIIKKADQSKLDATTKNEIGNHPVYELNLKIDNKIVNWNSMTTSILISIDYEATLEELKNPEFIVVWYIDNNGNIKPVPNSHYDLATKKVYFTTTHLSTYAIAYVNKNFSDLDRFKWAEKAIGVLAAKGITSGTGENKYSPEKNITRADFITLLVNTLELKAKYTDGFSDVKEGSYYAQSVNIAKALGITSGTGNNEVSPNTPITRQEMMVMIEKALKISNRELLSASTDDLARYTDVKDIQNYALNSIAVLVRNGIIEGSNNMINPKVYTNRAEAAIILYKLLDK